MHWKVSGLVNQDSPLCETAAKFFVHFDPEDTGSVFAPDIPVHYFAHQIKFLQNSTGK
jgi:hypothetical protein